ncbi:Lsr2 family DNA-binding protein [Cellulomonas triticagri]
MHPRETEVRRWAQARGIEAADRGRARFHVVEQYRRAHAGPGPATSP